jgi:hypothetical protein
MDRNDFNALRDLSGKVIRSDIKFGQRKQAHGVYFADDIEVENSLNIPIKLNVRFDPEIGSKTVNVVLVGTGPICRLDVDGPPHRPAGRSHKHSLQTERCPDRNLPDQVTDRPDLSGKSVQEIFAAFCEMAKIAHDGSFTSPPE